LTGFNNSSAGYILKSPAHLKAQLENPTEPTKAMEFGTAVHCAVFEPARFILEYVCCPEGMDRRTKAFKEFEQGCEGKLILSHDEWTAITNIVKAVLTHPVVEKLVTNGKPEQTILWKHETGLKSQSPP
jgi:hypothetical protein